MTGLQVQVQVLPGPWRTGKKGEALERSPVGGTALCDVVVRRGPCGRDGEGERGPGRSLSGPKRREGVSNVALACPAGEWRHPTTLPLESSILGN